MLKNKQNKPIHFEGTYTYVGKSILKIYRNDKSEIQDNGYLWEKIDEQVRTGVGKLWLMG